MLALDGLIRRRLLCVVLVLLAPLASVAAARAEVIVARDNAGRPMTFDVRVDGTDVEWYASVLRAAVHGDEIASVTIRIVDEDDVTSLCGASAAACYGRRGGGQVIVVPSGRSERLAVIVLHEYGHHVDRAWPVSGVREPNGTPGWFSARGVEQLLLTRMVTFDYGLGWSRSIGEIFAEDYAFAHRPGFFAIPWLPQPTEPLRTALLTELAGGVPTSPLPPASPPPAPPETTAPEPVVIVRRGTLAPAAQRVLTFRLVGSARRVTFTANVGGAGRAGARARIDVVCNGQRLGRRTLVRGQASRTLDLREVGPAACRARLRNTSRSRLSYVLRLRHADEAETLQS